MLAGVSSFLTMVISVLLGVWYRYVLLNPLLWTDELAIYCMIWMGFLAVGIGVKHDEHPSVEFIINRLPWRLRTAFERLVSLGILLLLLVVTVFGFDYAINSGRFRLTGALGISMVLPLLSVPVGSLFALLQLLLRMMVHGGTGKVHLQS